MRPEDLKKDYPELEQTILEDLVLQFKDLAQIKEKADLLSGRVVDESKKKRAFTELKNTFSVLSDEDLLAVLEKNKWDVELCYAPLVELCERRIREKEAEERKKELQKQILLTERKARELQTAYTQVPLETIKKILDDNEGDVEEATALITKLVRAENKSTDAQLKKRQEREAAIDTLLNQFPHADLLEVTCALTHANWKIDGAVQTIYTSLFERLKALFPSISKPDITSVLDLTQWNFQQASERLSQIIFCKKKRLPLPPLSDVTPLQLKAKLLEVNKVLKKMQNQIEEETLARINEIVADKVAAQYNPGQKQREASAPSLQPAPQVGSSVLEPLNSTEEVRVTLKAPSVVDTSTSVTVRFDLKTPLEARAHKYDWIGLFRKTATNNDYYYYHWAYNKTEAQFTTPANSYGEYQFRYITGSGTCLATADIKIGPTVKFTISETEDVLSVKWLQIDGNLYSNCWIGLYKKSESDSNYISYQYCSKALDNTLHFPKPSVVGQYEFRFVNTKYYVAAAVSQPYVVHGNDKVLISVNAEGHIKAELNLKTVDPEKGDQVWLGIFYKSESNNKRYRRYKMVSSQKQVLDFLSGPRTPGLYEARVFANGSFEPIIKSDSFEILSPDELK